MSGVNLATLQDLARPFHPKDLEWRVQTAKVGGTGPWAQVLTYVDNRAIVDRLDGIVGQGNWQNEFSLGPADGIICRIGIKVDGEWVWKGDGAGPTDIEHVKGALSGAQKRAASTGWGIGRYLYKIESSFAIIDDTFGRFKGRTVTKTQGEERVDFRWSPPPLPDWAIPGGVFTHRKALDYIRENFRKFDPGERLRVGKETVTIVDFLTEEGAYLQEDYLLALDLAEMLLAR